MPYGEAAQKRHLAHPCLDDGRSLIANCCAERVLLTLDCGFATFFDNPLNSEATAEAKMAALAGATRILRERHRIQLVTLPLIPALHRLGITRTSCLAAGPRSSVAQTSSG